MQYIQTSTPVPGCVFCLAQSPESDVEKLVVHRADFNFVILNRFPYTSGHLMVVPYRHVSSIEDLEPEARQEMMELANQSMGLLRQVYHPEAFNLGANIGAAAGAGIAEHVHLHIVPRWKGDTNFMTTVGQARVLPEELDETYRRVRAQWEAGQ